MSRQLPYLDAQTITDMVSWTDAVDALDTSLAGSLDPATALQRSIVDVTHGQLLLMPAESAENVGVKIATVAPDNPERGLPRVTALYMLCDPVTLEPLALMDGTSLTTLRTPSVSAVAAQHLADPQASKLTVFGYGPQAWGHVHAIAAVRRIHEVTVVARDQARVEDFVATLNSDGFNARPGTSQSVSDADIIACATTAGEPLYDGRILNDHACVLAIGSHDPDAREVDSATMARANRVVVESRQNALREGGDVICAIRDGTITESDLIDLSQVVALDPAAGISVFKSSGMGWQDLVIATVAYRRWAEHHG